MFDEIEWARQICNVATVGPWRVFEDRFDRFSDIVAPAKRKGYVDIHIGTIAHGVELPRNAPLVTLLGSIRGELFDVVEASAECRAAGNYRGEERADRCKLAEHEVNAALDALRTAIQAHRWWLEK